VVGLTEYVGTFLCPGDTIMMHITQTDLGNFGQTHLRIGPDWYDPFGQHDTAPRSAGEHDVSVVCDKFYQPGTPLQIVLVVWPGSGEAWIHYVRLGRGGSLAIRGTDEPRPRATGTLVGQRAYPNPTTKGVTFSVELPAQTGADLRIFDMTGALLRELHFAGRRGTNLIQWDGTDDSRRKVVAGIYCYQVKTETGHSEGGKVVVAE
jgi:hypothetical protein